MIATIDYGVNNLASVRNACKAAGGKVIVTSDPEAIAGADGIVFPGIGAAGAGMERLRRRGLDEVVRAAATSGRPFLAICLGMQLLFEWSEESEAPCLGILPGSVRRFRVDRKVPQIGWNQVEVRTGAPMWAGLQPEPYFYFVHSFVCVPDDPAVISGTTDYGGSYCSAVARGPLWGTQFHPERSGASGLRLIGNFVAACRNVEAAV